jgi:Fe-S cluster biosynthesis and repair protein YggX
MPRRLPKLTRAAGSRNGRGLDADLRRGLHCGAPHDAEAGPNQEGRPMADVTCARCGQTRAGLPYAPFNNDLGKRIQAEICNVCWQEWLKQQTMLINHYGLNVRDAEAKQFLYEQTDKFLFGTGEADQVDTSKQGTIQW